MLRGGDHHSPPLDIIDDAEYEALREKQKAIQLKYINKLIILSRAFSIHYYHKAKFWKYIYWVASAFSIGLSGAHTMINAFFDQCSSDTTVQNINVALGSLIIGVLSGLSVVNAPLRQRTNEEAGDKYNVAANNLFVEVFCEEIYPDLKAIIDKYVLLFDQLGDRYDEPTAHNITKIMTCEDYKFLTRLHEEII